MVGASTTYRTMKIRNKPKLRDMIRKLDALDSVVMQQNNFLNHINKKIDLVSSTLYGLLEMNEDTEKVITYIKEREKQDAVSDEKELSDESDSGSKEVSGESV
jgi:hypothetical protein